MPLSVWSEGEEAHREGQGGQFVAPKSEGPTSALSLRLTFAIGLQLACNGVWVEWVH